MIALILNILGIALTILGAYMLHPGVGIAVMGWWLWQASLDLFTEDQD